MSCLKGYVYALESPCYVVNHLAVITPYNCQTNFLKYYFDFHKPNCLVKDKSYPSISISDISNIELILPTVTEQNIISDNLCRIDNLIKKRQKQIEKLDELVKSRFIEMFEYKKFKRKKWGEVFDVTTGKLDSNAMSVDGKYPFFTCSKEVLKINEYAFDQEALLLAGNNAAGKYDVKYYNGKFNAYQRTYVISLKNDGCYKLFQYQLESKLDYLQKQSLGGLTKYLTLRILSELEFIIPPIELQNKFAEFVEKVEKNKSAIKKSLSSLETLKKSLMQKYFG